MKIITKTEYFVNKLSLRERSLLLATLLVLVFAVWYTTLYSYFEQTQEDLANIQKNITSEFARLKTQLGEVTSILEKESSTALASRAEILRKENKIIKIQIEQKIKNFVSPKDMVLLIKNMLDETEGLKLINLESGGTQTVFSSKKSENFEVGHYKIYGHILNVEFEGDFFSTMNFLADVEKSSLKVYWDNLDYEVTKYPVANVKLRVHTLSVNQGWIGA